ncbi:hypothetical protein Tco_1447896 [Tanacetum coccineum]
MDTLEEFKNVSGLTPSLPKSTAYFCNVLNYFKINILGILPFEEGKLPVKYLGVPLVPSRLLYHDCTELVEKVKKRICDWKNKSLSLAGRMQLIRSVLASMHVFWAPVSLYGPNGFTHTSFKDILFRKFRCVGGCLGDGVKSSKLDLWFGALSGIKLEMDLSMPTPILDPNANDCLVWKDLNNAKVGFSVTVAWDSIRPRGNANKKSARSIIAKLVFAAACYFIWKERNDSLFMQKRRTPDQVIESIISTMRLKLMSCRFKKTENVERGWMWGVFCALKWLFPIGVLGYVMI